MSGSLVTKGTKPWMLCPQIEGKKLQRLEPRVRFCGMCLVSWMIYTQVVSKGLKDPRWFPACSNFTSWFKRQ